LKLAVPKYTWFLQLQLEALPHAGVQILMALEGVNKL
jgi:hypothetical protein